MTGYNDMTSRDRIKLDMANQILVSTPKKSVDRERPFSVAVWVVSLLSCLSRLAPSVTRLCILGRFVRWTKKKERLLVVCFFGGCHATLWMDHCVTSQKTAVKETRLSL